MKKKNMIHLMISTVLIFSCVSCSTGFKKHESGLEYRFIEENEEGYAPNIGDIVVLDFSYHPENQDTVLEKSEFYRLQLNNPAHPGGSIENALAMMQVGDSAVFKIDARGFYEKTRNRTLPDFLEPGDKLIFNIRMRDAMSYEKFAEERRIGDLTSEQEEQQRLEHYLKITNTTVEPTNSGLYFVSEKKGDGKKPVPGRKVAIHYLGHFLDGKIFDTTYKRGKPFIFTFGTGEVIQGLDEGISKMRVGGKARLVIPSHLAYGDQQKGNIPPYSTLVFEVELLEVE